MILRLLNVCFRFKYWNDDKKREQSECANIIEIFVYFVVFLFW